MLTVLTSRGCRVAVGSCTGKALSTSNTAAVAASCAGCGFVSAAVVLWDLSEVLDDTLTCAYMKQVE